MLILVWVRTLLVAENVNLTELLKLQLPQFPLTYNSDESDFDLDETKAKVEDFFAYTGYEGVSIAQFVKSDVFEQVVANVPERYRPLIVPLI